MSDDIYQDVIRTESEGMNRKRVLIMDIYESADFVRDHDFRTNSNHKSPQHIGSDSVNKRNYRASTVCLGLLCVLLLTAVIVLSVYIYTNSTNYTQERNEQQTNNASLAEERDELLTNNTSLTEERKQMLTNITNLIQLNDELIQEKHELPKCFCGTGEWTFFQSGCYFVSSEKKSWTESRRYCTDRAADLIIINNSQEQMSERKSVLWLNERSVQGFKQTDKCVIISTCQNFVNKMSAYEKTWIGLTDSDVEDRWKWVHGTKMTSGFWGFKEPNGHTRENCAITYKSFYYDYACNNKFKWICEKDFLQ